MPRRPLTATRSARPTRPDPGPRAVAAMASNALGPRDGCPRAWSALLAAALCAGYVALAPHVPGDKDASEFTLVLATGGVLHPTGYPLYTLLGAAFVRLLHGLGAGYAFAANAWAALGGGVAMLLYHRLALRFLPATSALSRLERFTLAALPVALLGLDPVVMVECTVVEVHSWQLAWAFGTALVFTGLVEGLGRAGVHQLTPRMLGWGVLCGLGGAHHATSVFLAGALTLALARALLRARRFTAQVPLAWLAGGVVPVLAYAWIAWRPLHPGTSVVWPTLATTVAGVIAHATAADYRRYLGHFAPDEVQAAWLAWYVQPFLWPGLALFAWHAFGSRGARRLVAGALLAAALAQTLFAFRYGVGDPDAYFLPGLAIALLALPALGGAVWPSLRRSRSVAIAAVALSALGLAAFAANAVLVMRGRQQALAELDRSIHALWVAIPAERGIVLWPDDGSYRLQTYQRFRGEKPGLEIVNTASLLNALPRERFRQRHGFDPLGALDEAHRVQPLKPEYVIGEQANEGDRHAFAVIHEHIAANAGVPVIAFDPPRPPRPLPRPDAPGER